MEALDETKSSSGASIFVAMPVGEQSGECFSRLILPVTRALGLATLRVNPFGIDNLGIVETIRASGLVLADLTSNNPNVLYELGIASGLGIPVVLLASGLKDVPFDLQVQPVVQ